LALAAKLPLLCIAFAPPALLLRRCPITRRTMP
jgi:hypothetical protein